MNNRVIILIVSATLLLASCIDLPILPDLNGKNINHIIYNDTLPLGGSCLTRSFYEKAEFDVDGDGVNEFLGYTYEVFTAMACGLGAFYSVLEAEDHVAFVRYNSSGNATCVNDPSFGNNCRPLDQFLLPMYKGWSIGPATNQWDNEAINFPYIHFNYQSILGFNLYDFHENNAKYIGFRFLDTDANWQYGWIQIGFVEGTDQPILLDVGYQEDAEKVIQAGDIG